MYIDNFNFELPPELIAQYPLPERTQSRLLTLNRATGKIAHQKFIDLPDLLSPGDLLIFNDTKVIPARLFGVKTSGGKVEILIERILDQHRILAHIKGSKSLKIGACIQLENNFNAEIIDQHNNLWELKFCEQRPILEILKTIGHIPLPPYIQRSDELLDQERYQTVYAKNEGAVAAPTAGLHFDENLLQKLISRGIETAYITLHVGAGTFQPVRTENIKDHKMHA
jgi:S-adenosylmethionine:tRNA ribosyltransferase-isomerase